MEFEALATIRSHMNLSGEQFAKLLGFSYSTYTGWQTRGKVPEYAVNSIEAHFRLDSAQLESLKKSRGIE